MRFFIVAGFVASVASGSGASAQINEDVNAGSEPYFMNQGFFTLPEGRTIGSTVL